MTEISVTIPSYNEAENLKVILPVLKQVLDSLGVKYEILIIDTQEKMDDTEQVCVDSGVCYIKRERTNSYGDAIRTGIKYAQGKYLIIMDADGSHDPNDVKTLYKCVENDGCDLAIGSRYCQGGSTDNNIILLLMSWLLNVVYRIAFGLKVKDISNSFRIYKLSQLKNIRFECDNFDIVEEMLIKLNYSHEKILIKEIPIHFNKRSFGESKRSLFKFILSYINTMKRLICMRKNIQK